MLKVRSALTFVALLFFGVLQSYAQLRGEVVDLSGAMISRTTVRILDAESRRTLQTLRTGTDAHFEFRGLSPGRYLIAISSSGFSPEVVEVNTAKPDAEAFRTIRMHALDCDAPNVNCDCFSQCPALEPHPIVAQASLKIDVEDAIDPDKAAVVSLASPDAGVSLFEKDGGLYLGSLNGAVLLNACKPEYGRVRQKTSTPQFRVDGLDRDTQVCMTTKRGRFSEIFLTAEVRPGDQNVLVYVVTRSK